MGYIGGYELHLYCDEREECSGYSDPAKVPGQSKTDAVGNAREKGWTVNLSGDGGGHGRGRAVCPQCSGK